MVENVVNTNAEERPGQRGEATAVEQNEEWCIRRRIGFRQIHTKNVFLVNGDVPFLCKILIPLSRRVVLLPSSPRATIGLYSFYNKINSTFLQLNLNLERDAFGMIGGRWALIKDFCRFDIPVRYSGRFVRF